MGSSRGGKVEGGRGRRGVHEGRSKCSKGRREARVVRLDGTGGSQRVKRQREGRSKREIARGWAPRGTRRDGRREETVHEAESEEREASPALLSPSFSFCHDCFYAFPLLLVRDIPGAAEEREEKRGEEKERRVEKT